MEVGVEVGATLGSTARASSRLGRSWRRRCRDLVDVRLGGVSGFSSELTVSFLFRTLAFLPLRILSGSKCSSAGSKTSSG